MDAWLNQIAQAITENFWIAPALALLAGVLTSFTPCSLSSVPLVVGYVGGVGEKDTKRAFLYSLFFAFGTAITFITLGVIASSAGKLMGVSSSVWYLILGILMVLMAMQTWGIFNFIPSANLLPKSKRRGFLGAFIAGILGGVFYHPALHPC
jgi:cytochrome c-type biogenesis protein